LSGTKPQQFIINTFGKSWQFVYEAVTSPSSFRAFTNETAPFVPVDKTMICRQRLTIAEKLKDPGQMKPDSFASCNLTGSHSKFV